MTNPYDSPAHASREPTSPNQRHRWISQAVWAVWWIGVALIVGSWFDIVSRTVGWVGFGMAALATFGSQVLRPLIRSEPEEYVILDSRLLNSKGEGYRHAMERFRNGAMLMYDGVVFGYRPNNEIACGVVADSIDLTDSAAMEIADHVKAVFEALISQCPEFASAVDGRTFRISIM